MRRIPLAAGVAALTVVAATARSYAATIEVPPVTISQLTHDYEGTGKQDYLVFPGPGYSSFGFVTAIAPGDVIVVRFQAPPGKKFVIHGPGPGQTGGFHLNAYWQAGSDETSLQAPTVTTFENFSGTAMSMTYSFVGVGNAGSVVIVERDYRVLGDLEFTALEFDLTVAPSIASGPKTFGPVASYSVPSLQAGLSGNGPLPDSPVMEIVDLATPARSSTWGRLKALYR